MGKIGGYLNVYLNDILGRKKALVATGAISLIGVLIELTSAVGGNARFAQFVVGKAIASISMGLAANIVPIYLSETSTGSARGFAVNMYQNVQVIGVIIAAGTVYATSTRLDQSCYLIPMGIQLIAPTIMVFASPLLPESPRWLVWNERFEEAAAAAERLFSTNTNNFNPTEYVNSIRESVEEDKRQLANTNSWADLFHGPDLRRLSIAVGIQCLQQAQGSSYMNNYIVSFLVAAGVTNVFPVIMGLYTLYYVAILTGHVLPDRFGRRPVLISTASICGVMLVVVAILVTVINPTTTASSNATVALIFIWEVSFGVQSPLIWITTAESAPTRNRERVLAVAVFLGFGVSLLIASVSPYLQDEGYGNLGGKIGFIWGAFSVITVVWVYFVVPEMKGFSLEQLDFLYANNTATRKFKQYKFSDPITVEGQIKVEVGGEVSTDVGSKGRDISVDDIETQSS
ncbi:general substrate transporter [Xylariales sp. PMI_506]|nr:general substrate transporter [Xylariales sp. PMI_506]